MRRKAIFGVVLFSFILVLPAVAQINVFLPDTSIDINEDLTVAIVVDPLDGYNVTACQFELNYDSSLLSFVDTLLANTLTKQLTFLQVNWSEPGKILLAGFSLSAISGSDTLLKILFHSSDSSGSSPLSFAQFQFNEGDPYAILHDGSVQVGDLNQVNVFIPDAAVGSDDDLVVPILVENLNNYDVFSYEFKLIYDSDLLVPVDTLLANTLSKQMYSLLINWSIPDTFIVGGFGLSPLSGSDTLIKILFHSTFNSGICPLFFSNFQFNDGLPSTTIYPGTVWVNIAPIPVELSAFQCEWRNGKVFLNWTTLSEKDNYGFYVQKAVGDIKTVEQKTQAWETIAFIPGMGTTSEPHEYEFIDRVQNMAGKNCYLYYRLKQTDTDGSFRLSPIRYVRLLPLAFDLTQNYPNPFNANTKFTFFSPFSGTMSLHLYNVLGQKIATPIQKKRIRAGKHDFKIQLAEYPAGVYFYQLVFKGKQSFQRMRKMIYLK